MSWPALKILTFVPICTPVADCYEACVEDCGAIATSYAHIIKYGRWIRGKTNLQSKKAIVSNNHVTPIIRQKRRFHERPVPNLPNDPAQPLQYLVKIWSYGTVLVSKRCTRLSHRGSDGTLRAFWKCWGSTWVLC